jgi:molybdopterin-guanine dinucleotide biosynthesis protein
MSRTTHNQRIARGLKKATGLGYQTCLNRVIAAAEAGLLPTPLDDAGIEKAVTMLASGITVTQPDVDQASLLDQAYNFDRGLVLFVGTVGTGRTTLLYDLAVKRANRGHLVHTVESPIESNLSGDYPGPGRTGRIKQIEYGGPEGPDFHEAQRRARINDPDVLLVGEIRDVESAHRALESADVGHLVATTMHANSVNEAIRRLITVFPPEQQEMARTVLSTTLRAVVVLRREKSEFFQETTLIDAGMRESIRTGGQRVAFPIGENTEGRPVSWRPGWEDYPALSLVGPSGTGKSVLAASLARTAREHDHEVFVVDTLKDGADYRDGHQTVIRTDKGAMRLLANLRTLGPFERLLIVEEPQTLRPDVIESLRRLVAEARRLRLRVVLVSQQDPLLGPVGSKVDFTPGTAKARGWAHFRDRSKARYVDVRVWGPTVDEIAAERRAQEVSAAPKAVAVDLRRLSTLLRAGLAPAPALAAVAKSSRNDLAREAFTQMAQAVGDGEAVLSDALRAHPHLFDEWVAAAVEAGETAGIVSQILDDVSGTLAAETS